MVLEHGSWIDRRGSDSWNDDRGQIESEMSVYHKMYAIFGHRANIVPPATAEDGLPPEVEMEEDSSVPITFLDSQKKEVGGGGEGDEIAHAETENLDDEFGDDGGAPDDEQPFSMFNHLLWSDNLEQHHLRNRRTNK
ncbi:hypothetical protein R1flu_011411 [Riccia fluitans]|uniref:Uncharacterized protein n=1 Tax=Riccia fluitans TaxID=41844 RepID=A0ABD1Z8X4_9MARC